MEKKNGKDNLIVPSSELARKNGRKGGFKKAENERKRKTMREALEMLMFKTELPEAMKERLRADGIKSDDDFTHQMVITRSLIAKAEGGDVQAYNAICAMIGQKPAEQIEVAGGVSTELKIRYVGEHGDEVFPASESEVDV